VAGWLQFPIPVLTGLNVSNVSLIQT